MVRRISCPVFVGRERELASVEQLRHEVKRDSRGAVVLVAGEPGVGKTRFAEEVAGRARTEGWAVFGGSCDEFGAESRPFAVLRGMATEVEPFLRVEAPGELERPAWAAIARLLDPEHPGQGDGGSITALCEDLFRRLAAVRPLVVVFDDLHWADDSSLGLFAGLARALRGSRALLVGCYRAEELEFRPALRALLAAVHRAAAPELLVLTTFANEEARRVASAIAGEAGADRCEELFERSGGNAFLLEELLASAPGELPDSVTEVVLARIDALGPGAREVAEAVALDTWVSREVLAAVLGGSPRGLRKALDELTSRGVLVERDGGYAFRHPLMREVTYERVPPGSRPLKHAAMAAALERGRGEAGAIARHWWEAGDREKALTAAIAAGRRAARMGAHAEAAVQFGRALKLWDELPGAEQLVGQTHAWLAQRAATALEGNRQYQRAVQVVEDALRPEHNCPPGEAALLYWRIAQLSGNDHDLSRLGGRMATLSRAVEAIDDAARRGAPVDPATEMRILSLVAFWYLSNLGLDEEARRLIGRVERLDGEVDSPVSRWALAAARAYLAVADGSADVGRHVAELEAVSSGPNQQHIPIWLWWLTGRHAEAIERAPAIVDRLFEHGHGALFRGAGRVRACTRGCTPGPLARGAGQAAASPGAHGRGSGAWHAGVRGGRLGAGAGAHGPGSGGAPLGEDRSPYLRSGPPRPRGIPRHARRAGTGD
jgi:hypothetical protein